MSMSYPSGLIDKLRSRGAVFEGDSVPDPPPKKLSAEISPAKERSKSKRRKDVPSSASPRKKVPAVSQSKRAAPNTDSSSLPDNDGEKTRKKDNPPKNRSSLRRKLFTIFIALVGLGTVASAVAGIAVYNHFAQLVPSVEELEDYRPPTVTTLYDRNGQLLGEIY